MHVVFFHPDYTVGFGIEPNLRAKQMIFAWLARGLIQSESFN